MVITSINSFVLTVLFSQLISSIFLYFKREYSFNLEYEYKNAPKNDIINPIRTYSSKFKSLNIIIPPKVEKISFYRINNNIFLIYTLILWVKAIAYGEFSEVQRNVK